MRKIIRLTESDLTRIVRRVISEEKISLDSQLISCLKNKGYTTENTGGKYRYSLEKKISPNTAVTLILTIRSQEDKTKAWLTITDHRFKVLYSNIINITPELLKNCQFYQKVVVAYGEALKKTMK
jgi:hypothetical protein